MVGSILLVLEVVRPAKLEMLELEVMRPAQDWVNQNIKKRIYPKKRKNKLENHQIGYIRIVDKHYDQNKRNFGHRKQV